ncbi:N-acetylglucosamine-6-phosphate deacetylase [Tuwongella immobilis]|uniref:Amidohydrolase-related domain-containing protein n=1 Tax=Tuwongella immobilis TaxID=692036 RepID=A0A6C2YTX5_9BACT|nr:amidohydrolase family protein [Tuwongella immobilis]VIP04841.1 n-acetylglucosamine-6-phosphate deacetylase : N-acetylglucosamine-6-phosphate deacetylase OS=Rhodopirellula baltica SWK14 GN=RBSWK_05717 PE=3 SV=1: Amidohydro_1 [Tuwongella immobilis]VTS07042.1 n-acetylglucosamine-6-phosphate deacetylase : N-acetylglucosamine-6-phosphate deacetylase OS=Rhodopirellula baltica SWK14 GN=RBSWK_05717 PE=3 SV=1: Amidohydro_1 [Tuwongella immobilis]
MSCTTVFTNGRIILPDSICDGGWVAIHQDRIVAMGQAGDAWPKSDDSTIVDLAGAYLAPGFVDLHVHGGDGADFMDLTAAAFRTVCRAHARHGTTAICPTSCVAPHDECVQFLRLCQQFLGESTGGARVIGGHFYGPYFHAPAKGCHPSLGLRPPLESEFAEYLAFGTPTIVRATVAPELPNAEAFARACVAAGIGVNAGHSHATFAQMEAAIGWGTSHVDHLFCAMSDRARLRLSQAYPMRGGVLEATLYFDELTTEVIADGKHLSADLLRLAFKLKGADRLAIVTDSSRGLDMPDGEMLFGSPSCAEWFRKQDGVGVTLDGTALASSVVGMDDSVRTFHRLTGVLLPVVVRMASLTPARIVGMDSDIGSIAVGKRADFAVMNADLAVIRTIVGGIELTEFPKPIGEFGVELGHSPNGIR